MSRAAAYTLTKAGWKVLVLKVGDNNFQGLDGGVFVTGSGYNPTLTIIALALRSAAHLVS